MECRRTADSNSFSCSQWLLQTWTVDFDFNKSKWATQLCFIKGSSDGGKYPSFAQPCSFHGRTDAMYSVVMTTNFARHILYNLWCFFYHLHYFKFWKRPFLSSEHGAYGAFPIKAHNKTIVIHEIAISGMCLFLSLAWNVSAAQAPTGLCS